MIALLNEILHITDGTAQVTYPEAPGDYQIIRKYPE
jgi:hypothetical protein